MFTYDAAVLTRFSGIRAGALHAVGVVNGPASPALAEVYRQRQQATLERLQRTPIAELPSIIAWRRAFSAFGAKPTQHRNAAESLLRRLSKKGDIPSISTLVDIGNAVAIRHALPVAVLDLAGITSTTTVRFATGAEAFTDLGATASTAPAPGEVIFVDDAGVVSARRWCWRQSAQSATSPTTTDVLVLVEGLHGGADDDVQAALADLTDLLAAHQRAPQVTTALLTPENPQMVGVGRTGR